MKDWRDVIQIGQDVYICEDGNLIHGKVAYSMMGPDGCHYIDIKDGTVTDRFGNITPIKSMPYQVAIDWHRTPEDAVEMACGKLRDLLKVVT